MTDLRALVANDTAPTPGRRRNAVPRGWEPGVRFRDDGTGIATVPAPERDAGLDLILAERFPGVDLEALEVLELRSWDSGGEPQTYVKVKVVRRYDHHLAPADVAKLVSRAARWKRRTNQGTDLAGAIHVVLGDWQLGLDYEAGGGPEATVDRLHLQLEETVAHCRRLRQLGQLPSTLVLWSIGDLIEQCSGHYASQQFSTTLTLRDQLKVARRMMLVWLRELAPLFAEVTVTGVASNHGEVRQGGKAITTPDDSYDLVLLENVAEVVAEVDALDNVSVLLPPDPLVAQLEVGGVRVAAIHGHQARGSGLPQAKLWRWWEGQTFGGLLDVDVLFAGHYHHTHVTEQSGRLLVGTPANDGGSRWLTDSTGLHSPPGTLTVVLNEHGWHHMQIMRGQAR